MNANTQQTHERGVSPVVGVALLIAIAVILAAVIGAVVLGIGVGMADAPQTSLEFEEDEGDLVVSHTGGDTLSDGEVVVRGDVSDEDPLNGDLSAGESQTIVDLDAAGAEEGDKINVVWQDPNGNDESVVASYTVQNSYIGGE